MKISGYLIGAALAAIMAFGANAATGVSTVKATPVNVKNYEINEVYKTAVKSFRLVDYDAGDSSTDYYSTSAVSLQWPTKFGGNNIKALQDSLLFEVFGTHGKSVEEAIASYVNNPIGAESSKPVVVDSVPSNDNVRVLGQSVDVSSVGFCEKYIVFRSFFIEDGGGAHPVSHSHFLNYDIESNKVLYYNDIFLPGNEKKLLDIIKQALCDKYYASDLREVQDKGSIFIDQLMVSREVYLTDRDIVFYYNPYDIAPWSAGAIEVPVSVYDLGDYLTPTVKSLYNIQ
jgi:hypothetical protein